MILPMLERCLKMTISAITTENGKKGLASQRLRNGRLTAAATDPAETILVTAMTAMAMTATARASLYFYNTEEEVDRFLNSLGRVRGMLGYAD